MSVQLCEVARFRKYRLVFDVVIVRISANIPHSFLVCKFCFPEPTSVVVWAMPKDAYAKANAGRSAERARLGGPR